MSKNTEKVFTFERISNMVMLISDCNTVWYAWDAEEFTDRKRNNAIARIKAQFNNCVCFVFNV